MWWLKLFFVAQMQRGRSMEWEEVIVPGWMTGSHLVEGRSSPQSEGKARCARRCLRKQAREEWWGQSGKGRLGRAAHVLPQNLEAPQRPRWGLERQSWQVNEWEWRTRSAELEGQWRKPSVLTSLLQGTLTSCSDRTGKPPRTSNLCSRRQSKERMQTRIRSLREWRSLPT